MPLFPDCSRLPLATAGVRPEDLTASTLGGTLGQAGRSSGGGSHGLRSNELSTSDLPAAAFDVCVLQPIQSAQPEGHITHHELSSVRWRPLNGRALRSSIYKIVWQCAG